MSSAQRREPTQVERMEDWIEEEQTYFSDPQATRTCLHLAPVERAIRQSGIAMHVVGDWPRFTSVRVECRIDEGALFRRFSLTLAPCVRYYAPQGVLLCSTCDSTITTEPARGKGAPTPTFPSRTTPPKPSDRLQ